MKVATPKNVLDRTLDCHHDQADRTFQCIAYLLGESLTEVITGDVDRVEARLEMALISIQRLQKLFAWKQEFDHSQSLNVFQKQTAQIVPLNLQVVVNAKLQSVKK